MKQKGDKVSAKIEMKKSEVWESFIVHSSSYSMNSILKMKQTLVLFKAPTMTQFQPSASAQQISPIKSYGTEWNSLCHWP